MSRRFASRYVGITASAHSERTRGQQSRYNLLLCRNRKDRQRRQRAREDRISSGFKRLLKDDKPGRVQAIIESLTESSGGQDKFFRDLHEFYHGNSLTPAGRRRLLDTIIDLTIQQGELKMEAEATERAAREKAHAEMPELVDRMALDELLRTGAPLYRQHGWTVNPPREQNESVTRSCG